MLNPFAEIRRDERRRTYGAFLVLFGILAGHSLLETARDALFLASLPPERLAWVYLAVAVVSLSFFLLQEARLRNPTQQGLMAWLLLAAAVNVGFWALTANPAPWMFYALYTWSGVTVTLLVVRFWGLVGDVFGTVGEAKRLYGPIVAGSVLGAIFGSSLARGLAGLGDPRLLLLVASGIYLLTAAGVIWGLSRPDASRSLPAEEGRIHGLRNLRSLRSHWSRPFLRRVAAIVFVSAITLTLVDFLFKSRVARHVDADQYASFFAGVYLVLNLLAAIFQFFLVVRIMRDSRIHRVHALLPALILLGTMGLLLGGGLVAAVLLKGFDGSLRHSLHRTATEVLYVPLPAEQRRSLRGFFDALGHRGGQVVAAMAILVAGVLGPTELLLGLLVLLMATLWLIVAWTLEPHYLGVFRSILSEFSGRSRLAFPELDLASLETLMAALNSEDDEEVKAALDVLAEQGRTRLIPALILYHPSSAVVIRALELFAAAGRLDFVAILGRLLEHGDPEVRAAALRTRAWVAAPDLALYHRCAQDSSPQVRTTALIGLVSYAPTTEAMQARATLDRFAISGTPEEKLAVAQAIRFSPGAGYERVLMQLAETQDERVRLAVAQAMREILSPRFLPKLLGMLASRRLREDVRATLAAMGSQALQSLDEALGDERLDRSIRMHLPRAIAAFPAAEAGPILLRQLQDIEDGPVRYRILRALGRLRAENPNLALDEAILQRSLETTLRHIFQLLDWKLNLRDGTRRDPARATPVQELMTGLLEHKQTLAMERLFRHVGLLYPYENVRTLYRGWRNPSRRSRDSSRELLQHILEPPLREPILSLTDDLDDEQKLLRGAPYASRYSSPYEELLRQLVLQGGMGMCCLVAYHIGELHLLGLRPTLEQMLPTLDDLPRRSVENSLRMLGDSESSQASEEAR